MPCFTFSTLILSVPSFQIGHKDFNEQAIQYIVSKLFYIIGPIGTSLKSNVNSSLISSRFDVLFEFQDDSFRSFECPNFVICDNMAKSTQRNIYFGITFRENCSNG